MARFLVTGAAGFIGRMLCRELADRGHAVLGLTRHPAEPIPGVELRPVGNIGPHTAWSKHLERAEVVIHLANRAHRQVREPAASEAEAAAALVRAMSKSGVRRLVHMSSIKAMGESTSPGAPFRANDPTTPREAYGRGKLAIEHALQLATRANGPELVILRPPLVYGPGARANFRTLIELVASGLPLPFAGIGNRRSLIFLDNLVDLVSHASLHPEAAGRVLLARDAVDLSTPELIRILAAELGRPARLFALPSLGFAAIRAIPVLAPMISRLTLSLQVDDRETRELLGWEPRVPPEAGLALTARAFRKRRW